MDFLEKKGFCELDLCDAIYTLIEREKELREEYVKSEEDYQRNWEKNLDENEFWVLSEEKLNRTDAILKEINDCITKREKLYQLATPVCICYFTKEYYYRADEYDYEFFNAEHEGNFKTSYEYRPETNEMVRVRDILMKDEVPYLFYQLDSYQFFSRLKDYNKYRHLPKCYMRNKPQDFSKYCELVDASLIDELLELVDKFNSEEVVDSTEEMED
ncbi:MAG: hypothetical protein IJZ42_07105 [Lachnospiraceae bacterium]|nr:hypothetical protein [Lachnospiraceae bacterium]